MVPRIASAQPHPLRPTLGQGVPMRQVSGMGGATPTACWKTHHLARGSRADPGEANCSEAARWCRAASPMTRSTGFRLPCKAARYTVVEIYAPQIQASEIVMHDKAEIETSGEVSGGFHCVSEVCSPQAWGWPAGRRARAAARAVFPTGVGMARTRPSSRGRSISVPHRRGDGPSQPWPL